MNRIYFSFVLVAIVLSSCKSGPFNLIKPASPHEAYKRKLISSGLDQTYMGTAWINRAHQSLAKAVSISLPYQEKGYFAAEKIESAVFNFNVQRGQKLNVSLLRKPADRFKIYIDLLMLTENSDYKVVASADTLGNGLAIEIDKTGAYLLRLQPELLSSGEYTLSLTTGPSLNFPLKTGRANQIQSIFGDGRDANTRKHEGIDIFAPFRTPVIAVSAGRVTAVNENNLGGKVVWFRPEGKEYTLYYAHLDEQTVADGQLVNYGDTLGRMGNTGNAKTTAPHLHFGIYTRNGAIDPFPFVNPVTTTAPPISVPITSLNASMRTSAKGNLQNTNGDVLESGALVRVNAASGNSYRVELPNGRLGFVTGKQLVSTTKPLKTTKITDSLPLFERPDSLSAVKGTLKNGDQIAVLGIFGEYQFVEQKTGLTGWMKK
jgi:murein DD-endopeptidase MepM/ murein hydrolase activator NlpD